MPAIPPGCTRVGHILLCWSSGGSLLLSVTFFAISINAATFRTAFVAGLVNALVGTLCLVVLLNLYTISNAKKAYRNRDDNFRSTDREYLSIFQNVLDGILIVDTNGNCLDVNPATESILRCPASRIIGQKIDRYFPDYSMSNWNSLLAKGSGRGHARIVGADGKERYVDYTVTADYLPKRHVLIICDVTDRTRAELSLRESQTRIQEMADHIAEIFWRIDAETQSLTYVNAAYARVTGYDVEAIYESPSSYRDLIHPEDRVRVLSRLQETLATGSFDEEFRFTHADATIRWVWAKGSLVPPDSAPRRIVGTAQDITSRKQAEIKLLEQLELVEAARAEAEALRKTTLALSQNLAMDAVLDTMLACIQELVPFDKAAVMFVEDGAELLVAREAPRSTATAAGTAFPATACVYLERILFKNDLSWFPTRPEEGD